ncbi:hypothetical protein F4677DRAFT_411766 [Hypoxylon crocopeplum]|nr:hypothetical protein F4677DRAFT_411766 [Hypoxylon crocopeplum]
MPSITTVIPTAPIEKWCVGPLEFFDNDPFECANKSQGTQQSDFQTFCCDGDIINVARDFWSPDFWDGDDQSMNLSDMVCCGLKGPQAGGIQPIPTVHTQCADGSPTPLASLAGTNTENAVPFLVTYTSASYGDNTVGDYIPTETPSCFWAYTVSVATEEITLSAPEIKTLPPATTDEFTAPFRTATETGPASETTSSGSESGSTGSSSSTVPETTTSSSTGAETSSGTSSAATPTPSRAVSTYTGVRKGCLYLSLGLVAMSLFWS